MSHNVLNKHAPVVGPESAFKPPPPPPIKEPKKIPANSQNQIESAK